jgi:hypothetical protein
MNTTAKVGPHFGVVGLGLTHESHRGMATDAASFNFPIEFDHISASDVVGSVLRGDSSLYAEVLRSARKLCDAGAVAVGTSCGYFSVFQGRLAADLPVPVYASALAQVTHALELAASDSVIPVVWAAVNALVPQAVGAATPLANDPRLLHVDMGGPGHFRDAILSNATKLDVNLLTEQVLSELSDATEGLPPIAAIVLECGDICVSADAVRDRFGCPVYDYVTYFEHAAAAVGIKHQPISVD